MGKSRKKNPITGITVCESEKQDKRLANRRLRRRNKMRIEKGEEPLDIREVSDVWTMGKDGKIYWGEDREDLKRK